MSSPAQPEPRSLQRALVELRRRLEAAAIPDASLEAQVLMMHASGWPRERLLASFQELLAPDVSARLQAALQRRLQREPLAYITGHREFFGLDLLVDRRVLVPRQETECLVEEVIAIASPDPLIPGAFPSDSIDRPPLAIADVGTGSGAIAIALASSLPKARVYAIDASAQALEVAAENIRRLRLSERVTLFEGDLLEPLDLSVDIVAANLPYIRDDAWESLQPEIRLYEPRQALTSGPEGLDAITRLLHQIRRLSQRPLCVVLETGEDQAAPVAHLAEELLLGSRVRIYRDLASLERGVVVRL